MKWKIGASTGGCVDRPIVEVLDAIHEAHLSGVELGTPPRHFDPWHQWQVAGVHERLQTYAIKAVSIHAPFGGVLDLSDPNSHNRHAAIGACLTAASALQELGGSIVVVHPSDVPRDHQDVQMRLEQIRASLRVLARGCGHMGLQLAIESPLPHLIGGHPDEFSWLLKHVPPTVVVCLDTGHTTLGRHWAQFAAIADGRLKHVHANDHGGHFDDHLPPGDGIVQWKEIGDTLRGLQFNGWLMLELGCPLEPLSTHLARAAAQMESLLVG